MLNIEFILPYSNIGTAVQQAFDEHPQHRNMNCKISFITHDKVKSSEIMGDIIIARGLTAMFLNKMLKDSFTVVEIPMSGYDILKAIRKVKKLFNVDKIALIATESTIYGFEEDIQDFVSQVSKYEVTFDSDIPLIIKTAIREGAEAIIGGNEVISITESLGYKGVRIETEKQGIRQALDEAWSIHISKHEEELRISRLNAVIENIGEGIIACDERRKVTICNMYAQSLIGKPMCEIIGEKLSTVHAELEKTPFNLLKKKEWNSPVVINGVHVVITRIPVIINSEFVSGTIVIQKLSNIQKIDLETTINAKTKGLVAKNTFKNILGESKAILRAKKLALNYTRVQSNVLLLGETGTGKELFAQSIHNASDRKDNPFVAINCATFTESLLESELFGYSDGAFTGASRGGKQGLFELADKGTIFLDEITEMSYSLQGRLLRVLEERTIRRIGHDKVIPVDVRIIAASNQNIELLVKEKKFRQDLFYRLDVLRLTIPPLRERKEDIPMLVEYFVSIFDKKNKMCKHIIDSSVFSLLQSKYWPGNIRQLKNFCEKISTIISESLITVDLIKDFFLDEMDAQDMNEEEGERNSIKEALNKYHGNKTDAANYLGIDRTTLYRKMKKFQIM